MFSSHVVAQWVDGQAAFRVLGQPDFISNTANNGGISNATLQDPHAVCFDVNNEKLYVVDQDNIRILRYDYSGGVLADMASAERVFGDGVNELDQNSMSAPRDCDVDSSGRLWIIDNNFRRVLWWNNAHTVAIDSANADGVLGQSDFTSGSNSTTQSGLSEPHGLAIDSVGNLWVGDLSNQRVMRWDNVVNRANNSMLINGANADGVLGQTDFIFNTLVDPPTQSSMQRPMGLVVDSSGTLWVADYRNNRVLRFDNAAAKADGANADGVLGQTTFITNSASSAQNGLNFPVDVTIDNDGRLYVLDANNNRVIIFDAAAGKTDGANADNVIGQPDFATTAPLTTASIINPGIVRGGVTLDSVYNRLWVADDDNNRVLGFAASVSLPVELQSFHVE